MGFFEFAAIFLIFAVGAYGPIGLGIWLACKKRNYSVWLYRFVFFPTAAISGWVFARLFVYAPHNVYAFGTAWKTLLVLPVFGFSLTISFYCLCFGFFVSRERNKTLGF